MTDEKKPVYHPWLVRFFYTAGARDKFIDRLIDAGVGTFNWYESYQPLAHRKYKLEFNLSQEGRTQYVYEHHPIEAELIKKS